MWDDIIIGKGEKLCTAYKCWVHKNPEWCNVSENRSAYWITMPQFFNRKGMTIYKDTKEGEKIKQLLADKQDKKLNDFLFKTFFRKIKPEVLPEMLVDLIQAAHLDGIREGKKMKQLELQRVLGL
jgi:hypothetical protein